MRGTTQWAALVALSGVVWADPVDPGKALHEEPMVLTAPLVAAGPHADGVLSPDEWAGASATAGFLSYDTGHVLSDSPTLFVVRSASALHALCLVPVDPRRGVAAAVTERDGPVYREDSVELFLCPDGANVYQIIVNAVGTVADLRNDRLDWVMGVLPSQGCSIWSGAPPVRTRVRTPAATCAGAARSRNRPEAAIVTGRRTGRRRRRGRRP